MAHFKTKQKQTVGMHYLDMNLKGILVNCK